jgi:hypothetical protein
MSLLPKNCLFQVIPNYQGTNAEYYRKEEKEKITKGGAVFVILQDHSRVLREFKEKHNVDLFYRSDDSVSEKVMKAIVKKLKGTWFNE